MFRLGIDDTTLPVIIETLISFAPFFLLVYKYLGFDSVVNIPIFFSSVKKAFSNETQNAIQKGIGSAAPRSSQYGAP